LEQKEQLIWWKWTKRIVASLGILVVLFVGISILVVNLYEEEIKHFAVEKINENLTTEVDVKSIDLTLIEQFPMASLRFSDVFIADKLGETEKDTMIAIEYLYLNLNFMDLINGKYDIKDIKASNATAYLKIDQQGNENYLIWKQDSTSKKSQFSFDLEQVKFKDLTLKYTNQLQRQNIAIATEQLKFNGNFSDVSYHLKTKGEVYVKDFTNDSINYLSNKNATIDLDLLVNTETQAYEIKKGNLAIEDLSFEIIGNYINSKESSVDLGIKGQNISFISVFSIFPQEFLNPLKKYDSKGLITFDATLKGNIGKNKLPKIKANFSLEQGSLTEKNTGISLQNLSLNGEFSNQNKHINSQLILNNIEGKFSNNGGNFDGQITLKDFTNLKIESQINANLNLGVIKDFVALESIKELTGTTTVNYQLKGSITNNKLKIQQSLGTLSFNHLNLATTSNALTYQNITGSGQLKQNDLIFNNITGSIGGSEITGHASLRNLIPHLINPNQTVWVDATVQSKKIDLGQIIAQLKSGNESPTSSNDSLQLPQHFQVKLNTTINELIFNDFEAKNCIGTLQLKQQKIVASNIRFKTSGGNVLFNSEIEQRADHHFLWTGDAKLDHIDIQHFFTAVNNFGQDFLTHQHLKGKGSLLLNFGMVFSPNLSLLTPSIKVNAKSKITNGVLINHPTMNELATYLDENKLVNKVVDTKKLKKKVSRIKFSELNNSIEIKNNHIVIPKTTIKTNILDIDIAGEHSFDNTVDYHFSFGLRDVLIKNKHAEDFGPVKDDGLGKVIFLHVFGHLDDLNYAIDKSEKKANRKQIRAEEKQNVKAILKNEFGLFKKDTSLHTVTKKEPEPTFEIENWEERDEEPATEEIDDVKEKSKPKKEKKTPKWLKKLGVDEQKEQENNISVEFEEE
jgi:hypothetical protein